MVTTIFISIFVAVVIGIDRSFLETPSCERVSAVSILNLFVFLFLTKNALGEGVG